MKDITKYFLKVADKNTIEDIRNGKKRSENTSLFLSCMLYNKDIFTKTEVYHDLIKEGVTSPVEMCEKIIGQIYYCLQTQKEIEENMAAIKVD